MLQSTSQQRVPASILPVLTMPSSLGPWAARLAAGSPSHSGCLFSAVLRPCAVRDSVLLSSYLCSTLGTSSEPCQPISWQHPPKQFSLHCVIVRRRGRKVDTERRFSKGKQVHKAKFSSPSNQVRPGQVKGEKEAEPFSWGLVGPEERERANLLMKALVPS